MSRNLPFTITTPEKLVITIKKGCVTREKVDVVINSTNESLNLIHGELSGSILKAAGSVIQDECKKNYPDGIDIGIVAITTGGKMPAKAIYHGSLSPWLNGNGEADLLAYIRCFLDHANLEGRTSMAIPAISTGVHQFPPKVVAKVIYEEIFKFSKSCPDTSLKDIRINLIRDPQLTEFTSYFRGILSAGVPPTTSNPANQQPNARVIGATGGLFMAHLPTFLSLEDEDAEEEVQGAEGADSGDTDLTEPQDIMIAVRTSHGVAVHVKIGNISSAKADVIVNVTTKNLRMYHGAISKSIMKVAGKAVEQECKQNAPNGLEFGRLVKTGAGGLRCQAIYHGTVRDWSSGCGEQDLRKLMSNILDAADLDGYSSVAMPSIGTGQVLGYPPATVAKCMLEEIENFGAANTATSLTLVEVVLYDKDARALAEFQSYMSAKYNVKSIPLPATWSPMSQSQLFKMDVLAQDTVEYKTVSKRFTDNGGPNKIQKIQRVQCPNMYQLFAVRQRQVETTISDKTKFKVVQTLYHGTSRDALDGINTLGFNRSFCGRNAAVIGYGSYFAKKASYSCQDTYSPADRHGYKHVYQCRVVTGEYTLGQAGYILPPAKDPAVPNVLYDSVVNNATNPTVFVVFYDAQAYPEYLITFKK